MSTILIKERPILFSGAMVRALLAGTKTQTRRVVKGTDLGVIETIVTPGYSGLFTGYVGRTCCFAAPCPYGQPGDRLWVRETFLHTGERPLAATGKPGYIYRAESNQFEGWDGQWKPSIFMPRVASRLLLEITAVRCERLQDISKADAMAEGINLTNSNSKGGQEWENYLDDWAFEYFAKDSYATLWEKINGLGSWAANPWVWVVEFKVIDGKEAVNA